MDGSTVILSVENLNVRFKAMKSHYFEKQRYVHAVEDVSFALPKGKSVGLVGESGSGKTTIARAIMNLAEPFSGDIKFLTNSIYSLNKNSYLEYRKKVQFIFQDPYSSLNPRYTVSEILQEPMKLLNVIPSEQYGIMTLKLLTAVGLREEQQYLFPHQFSGGQRQRIAIARALASKPELLICDEPVSALDVAVQAQILNLLKDLQNNLSLTYLFISHDLGVIQYMCDYVIVLYLGQITEMGPSESLFASPLHPYTKALLDAVPSTDPREHFFVPTVECIKQPSAVDPKPGCRYANICNKALKECYSVTPLLKTIEENRKIACHLF